MSKILVAYFSASGVTKNAAEKLAKAANADLFEIKPVRPSLYRRGSELDGQEKPLHCRDERFVVPPRNCK